MEPAPETAGTPGLACVGVTVRLGRRTVLDNVDFDLGPGITGLVGINGAGKTTLMRVLAGIVTPHRGRVEWRGGESRASAPTVRLVPQETSRVGWLTAEEYVTYSLYVSGHKGGTRACAALERTGLGSVRDVRVDRLSGGEARRLAIAAAVASDADVLLLDEPTAGLDPLQRDGVHALIKDLAPRHTILVSSHLSDDIEALVGSVAVLAQNRIMFRGSLVDLAALAPGSGSAVIAHALAWAQSAPAPVPAPAGAPAPGPARAPTPTPPPVPSPAAAADSPTAV